MQKEIFGLVSVVLYIATIALYIRSSLQGRTRPHAFTWGLWALTGAIFFFAQHVERAGPGAWFQGAIALCAFAVTLLALTRYGDRGYTRQDWLALGFALLAIPLWIATGTPLWSVLLLCAIDLIGFYPTLRKSWSKPHEEHLLSYAVWTLSALSSLAAVENYSLTTALPPLSALFIDVSLVIILPLRRWRMKKS